MSLMQVAYFLYYGLKNGRLRTRASALSFRIVLTIVPFLAALVVLLGWVGNLTGEDRFIIQILETLPTSLSSSLSEIVSHLKDSEVTNVAFIGIFLAIFYGRKAFREIFVEFYLSDLKSKKVHWIRRELISVLLVIISLVLICIMLIVFLIVDKYLEVHAHNWYENFGIVILEGILIFTFLSIWLSIIYSLGTRSKNKVFRLFSPGMVIASLVIMAYSWVFFNVIYYISAYNEYYGFLGAGIISMIWIYTCSFVLLIGFELNSSIKNAIWNMDSFKTKKQVK